MQKVLKLQIALKAGILVLWCMFRLVLEAMHWRQNHSWCQELLPSRRLPCANHFQGWFFVLKITVGYHWEIIDMVKNLKMLSIQVVGLTSVPKLHIPVHVLPWVNAIFSPLCNDGRSFESLLPLALEAGEFFYGWLCLKLSKVSKPEMVIDQEMWIFLATKREGNQKKKKAWKRKNEKNIWRYVPKGNL